MTVDIDRPAAAQDPCSRPPDLLSLVELLRLRARLQPDQTGYTFLTDGEEEGGSLTFGELDRQARAIGACLQRLGAEGRTVLLLYPPGLDFVAGFLGCLYAGAVAVPAYPPRSQRSLPRLLSIARDAGPAAALTTRELLPRLEALGPGVPELADLPCVATDELDPATAEAWSDPGADRDTLAFLQYTSGSTSEPKGVMVSHGNLLHNEEAIRRAFDQSERSVIVGWLPLYHDMGLIGNVLQPLYLGARCVLMSPVAFLQRPFRWVQAVSRYRATTSGGPNFAYDLTARKLRQEDVEALGEPFDLSSWTVAFNGAEPVRAATLDRFAAAFAPYGFRREAFYPCYGLAEATLFVTGGEAAAEPVLADFDPEALERGEARALAGDAGRRLVGCGRTWGEHGVLVVDPDSGLPCPDGAVGEIWVRGPSVARGYWRRPEATGRDFSARLAAGAPEGEEGPYLRTGDLGFLRGGELFVTGRLKDLIILRGRNLYPQDVELTAERAHPALRPGCGAAFEMEAPGGARLAVVQEVHRRHHGGDLEAMADAIRRAVAEEHDARVDTVALIRHGTILKTSSGKIRRSACRAALLAGELAVLAASGGPEAEEETAAGGAAFPSRDGLLQVAPAERRALLAAALRDELARGLGVAAGRIDPREPVLLDSLAALELKSRVDAALGLDLPLAGLLQGPTPEALTETVLEALAAPEGEGPGLPPVVPAAAPVAESPLSYGQRALWLEHRLAPESPAYTVAFAARLQPGRRDFDPRVLPGALAALVGRHPVLGAVIEEREDGPVQVYRPDGEPRLDYREIDAAAWSEGELRDRLDEELHRPFDLTAAPPLRARLFRRHDGPVLLLAFHHVAIDLHSLVVLLGELGADLQAPRRASDPALEPPPVAYPDYVAWQERWLSGARGEEDWRWWRERLAGAGPPLDLPTDRPRPASRRMRGAAVPLDLPPGTAAALADLARRDGGTLFMALLGAFAVLVARHAGQDRVVVGSPAAGRPRPELRGLVGYLVNPLPLPVETPGDLGFREVLARLRETVLGALAHEAFPLALLAERLAGAAAGGAADLFRTLFVLERPRPDRATSAGGPGEGGTAPFVLGRAGGRMALGDLELESVPFALRGAQVDLALTLVDDGAGAPLAGELRYDADLFDRTTAERMARRFSVLVSGLLEDPERPVAALPLLAPVEAHQLRHEWNDAEAEGPGERLIHHAFRERARRLPEAAAVAFGDERIGYGELAGRVSRLADHLRGLGVGPDVPVGLFLERSVELVVGLLAVLEAGGAYLPLDPTYPAERVALMAEDAAVPVVLAQERLRDRLPARLEELGVRVVAVDRPPSEDRSVAGRSPGGCPEPGPDNLAYLIYTSGSTGRPKGVQVPHRTATNLFRAMDRCIGCRPGDRFLAVTTISFDISVVEILWTLARGGEVVLVAEGAATGAAPRELATDGAEEGLATPLAAAAARHRPTLFQCTPSMMAMVLEDRRALAGLAAVHTLVLGGEPLSPRLVERIRRELPAVRVVNGYGPTETTVYSSMEPVSGLGPAVPIGRPVANHRLQVLDATGRPVPPGVPGELAIGGAGVTRGYRRRPALTAERFVPDADPSGAVGARLYRSGDLARFRPDGRLDCLGRLDFQVKVRGHRIELGEVEAALARHPAVAEAVAVARRQGDEDVRLLAYVVPSAAQAPAAAGREGAEPEALLAHLRRDLPEWMVPGEIVLLDELPLTPSGKVDRRALPEPGARQDGEAATAPRTPTESRVAEIWCEVLGLDAVGVDRSFFRLGGHSLLATRLASRVSRAFGVELPLRVVFERPTVAALAGWLDARSAPGGAEDAPLVPVSRPAPGDAGLPLSFAQERLWFLEQMDPGRPVYNMAGAARVAGELDPALLAGAVAAVAQRHEALRTVFPVRNGGPVQEVLPASPPPLPVVDLSRLGPEARTPAAETVAAAEAHRPFDLAAGPLLRTALVRLAPAEHVVLVTLHHVVSDGWSIGVFLRELAACYRSAASGGAPGLPPLPVQYADYAVWQRERLAGERLDALLAWWRERMAGAPELLELPADHPRPPRPSQRGVTVRRRGGAVLAEDLAKAARRHEATTFMLLLAALDAFLYRYTGQVDLVVGSPAANRDRVEIEGLVGFFVNTVVHRSDLSGRPSFGELLGRVREATLDALAHQDVPFVKLVEALRPARDPSHPPLFQVMLAVEPAWGRAEIPGLVLDPYRPDTGVSRFDLTFQVQEEDHGVELALEANLDLFEPATAERMLRHFAILLQGAVADPDRRLADLPLLSESERRQLLDEWNRAGATSSWRRAGAVPALLHEEVARRAEEAPDSVAVVFAGGGERALRPVVWSYRELVARAERLATALAGLGVGPDVLVGLSVERSPELVLGVLGVLRAGGAWLPLDPSYPPERLQWMVDDAAPRVLLTQERLLERLPETAAEVVLLDRLEAAPAPEVAPASPDLQPENLAYVIYTSGSTGRPKGVALSHRGLANLRLAQAAGFAPGPDDRVVQFAPASFDASVFELTMALASGAQIHLADPDALLPGEPLARLFRERRITSATLPPSALAALPAPEAADLPALTTAIVAGEACPPELARAWGDGGRRRFFNAYGPTETTVWATVEPCAEPDAEVTIGRPIENARVHLLDGDGVVVPVGVPAELHVGGPGLARGYLHRPALTAERFVPDPFGGRHGAPGARLYRTGDLARRLPDGRIDFLGRVDHQVKVRGFRIELGEIEATLTSHPEVAEAVVLPREGGAGESLLVGLAAYVLARAAGSEEELRRELLSRLSERLPSYMVPSALRVLPDFPRTPAGKVDRGALAALGAGPAAGDGGEAPEGPVEELLAALWAELLELPDGAVSRGSSFFDLGGHSLLATRVTARVREELGVELPVRRLFERPVLADLAAEVEALAAGVRHAGGPEGPPERTEPPVLRAPPLVAVERDGPPPLSFAQERLWFLDRLQPGNVTYNVPVAVRLVGGLDLPAFHGALADLVERHETLRTTFASGGTGSGEPVQVIAPPAAPPVSVVDLSRIDASDPAEGAARREAEARRLAHEEARTPFHLSTGPLLRTTLVRLGVRATGDARESEHLLLLDMHHAVSDGWSVGVLIRELGALYGARLEGAPADLPPLPVQYADYAVWQRRWLAGEVLAVQIAHWREALAGLPDRLELPTDRPRPPVQRFEGGAVPVAFGRGLSDAVDRFAREREATPFMVLLAAFQALLGRYAGQDDLAVGTPVANRTHAATEGLIGFFVNTLVLRGRLSDDPAFGELVARARETALGAYAHQDLPFEKLVEELQPGRSLGHSPLFQVLLVLQNVPLGPLELPGLTLEPLTAEHPAAKFDLTLNLREGGEGLEGELEYRRDLFDRATAERMTKHLRLLLESALEAPGARLSGLPWLTPVERRQLREWNDTAVAFPPGERHALLHELFASRARETPERVAVVAEGRHLTFGAFAAVSRALAVRLSALGVGPEVPVGVCAERSVELPLALAAVLEAGGAYVPFDPSYPPERLAFMLEDSGARVLIAQEAALAAVPELRAAAEREGVAVVGLGEAPSGGPAAGSTPVAPPPSALAYAIYTSGSTGRPKGAMNAHSAVVNRLLWMRDEYAIGADDRILQKTPFSFDVSVWELFLPLLAGARLVMANPGCHKDPALLAEVIRREGITTLHFVPSMLQAFVEVPGVEECRSVRRVIASGEALSGDLRDRLRARLAGAELHNLYGPTEAAIDVTAWPTAGDEPGSGVPIGRPVANTAIHVAGPGLRAVPPGVPGELLIGGAQVGRGYLGRPTLTAERFVPDPHAGPGFAGGRLYRTGDLARFQPDGAVEYLGRIDHQVKVRGFRIELGEIEAALERHPDLRQAVVIAVDGPGGDTRLAAYVVPHGEVDVDSLRRHLGRSLPDHMVPPLFTVLDELPLTPSGKADRRALPAPDWGGAQGAGRSVAPRTVAEELVAEAWARVLGVDRVGVEDDFFRLGGHSLLGARLMTRLQEATGVELPLMALFETPTVAGLARELERRLGDGDGGPGGRPIRPVPRDRPGIGLPLSPAQERLWFLDRLAPASPWYNVPAALRLRGELDAPALARSLAAIVRRHETLRTVIGGGGEAPVQEVLAPDEAGRGSRLPVVDLTRHGDGAARAAAARSLAAAEARRPFDLVRGPLFRAALLRLGESDHVLLLGFHHVVSDGWSLGVFLRELSVLYAAGGEGAALPDLPVQYADFAVWQRSRLAEGLQERQLEFWRRRLAGAPPVLELPADRPRPPVQSLAGGHEHLRLSGDVLAGLRRVGRAHGTTRFMTLLALVYAWLARHGAGRDLVVGSPVAGRDRVEVEGLIGFFVNLLPLRMDLPATPALGEVLAAARDSVLGAHAHREVPFEKLVEELRPARDASHAPLVQAVLVLEEESAPPPLAGLAVEPLELDSGTAKFDLNLSFRPEGDALVGTFEYNRDLFDATTARRLAGRLERLAAAVAALPDAGGEADPLLLELPLLSPAERHQVAVEWGETASRRPPEAGLAELFAAEARERPDRVAVADAGGAVQVSYGELARRARCLAGRLASLGVGPESRVGLALERSPLLVEAILGILEAGGAYVPLDPGYPEERLRFMLSDAGVEVLVTDETLLRELPVEELEARGAVVVLQGGGPSPEAGPVAAAPGAPDRLAYVMYTSGSTGVPKGVAVPQRAVVRLVRESRFARLGPDETFLHLAPVSFDASTLELWGPLLHGGRVVVVSERTPSLSAIGAVLARHRVTALWLTAGLFHQMVDDHADDLAPVEQLLAGGDVLSPDHVRAALERLPGSAVINGYGPTENTTFTCCHAMAGPESAADPVPVGRPIAGTRVHLLDPALRPVPIGVPGELCAGGLGLARGYVGRPAQTAERFVPDPLGTGGRLYRTGDLARFLPGGAVEFLGRIDRQVKVRGFRIELGEIEAALRTHPAVAEAAVLVHDDLPGGKTLVAYLAAEGGSGTESEVPEPAALRDSLRERLPPYMVPSFFVPVPELPLDPNGKVDRRALQRIGSARLAAAGTASASTAPRTATERALAAIWEEVLETSGVGLEDDFFDLGGHSLLATRVASRIHAVLGVEPPLRALFERPTLAALAAWVDEAVAREEDGTSSGAAGSTRSGHEAGRRDRLPLSFAQQRLWFLDRLEPGSVLYAVPAGFRLRGDLRPDSLARGLSRIVARHESLRTTFRSRGGEPYQDVGPPEPVPLPVVDLGALPAPRRQAAGQDLVRDEAERPFDLAKGPLLRALLVRLARTDHLLVVNQHHVVSDGWSVGVMAQELGAAYGAFAAGREPELPELPMQFSDWVLEERSWLQGETLERRLTFWRERLAGVPVLDLPTDRPRPRRQTHAGDARTAVLPAETAAAAAELARRTGSTLYMVLLSAFAAVLGRLSDQADFAVGTPVAGRGRRELEGLIGFFVNTLALRCDLSGEPTFAGLLGRVREQVLDAFAHQELPFDRVVEEVAPQRDPGRSPIFQASFALQEHPPVPELAGLEAEPVPLADRIARFDLAMTVVAGAGGLEVSIGYNQDLFDATRIARMLGHYRRLLEAALADPEAPVDRLPHLTRGEWHQLVAEWSDPHLLPASSERVPWQEPPAAPVLVLDGAGMPAAVGVPGELAVGESDPPAAAGDSRLPDSLAGRAGAGLHRTGELARRLPDGRVELLGPLDRQIRVRGIRVDAGEVEAALGAVPGVAAAAVHARGDLAGGPALVAYLVPERGAGPLSEVPPPAVLRKRLRERLAPGQVPSHFVPVPELPRDAAGGVDRTALTALGAAYLAAPDASAPSAPPRTPTERALVAIWENVLETSGVGVDDDFFDLGGHSLLATRLVSRVSTELGTELPLRALFDRPTVAALAELIDEMQAGPDAGAPSASPRVRQLSRRRAPLSFGQQRLWFIDRLEPGNVLYAVPAAFRFRGRLLPDLLARALSRIVARHEALRTTFPSQDGEPYQEIGPPAPVPLPVVDLRALPAPRRETVGLRLLDADAHRPFDLARGPLLRALLVRLDGADHLLAVNQHHIVSDGWSVGVMARELATAYGAFAAGREPVLPELPVQFADWAVEERSWLRGEALERRLAFWRERLAGVPVLDLPTDRPRPRLQTFAGDARKAMLPAETATAVAELARRTGSTLYMVLLSAFAALLARVSGQSDFAIGTPVAGRGRRELEELIGFFVNTLALRLDVGPDRGADVAGGPGFAGLLRRVREEVLDAFAHQELTFDRVVEEVAPERDLARPPIFQVAFALQQTPPVPELPGLDIEPAPLDHRVARFDLGMTAVVVDGGLVVSIGYNTDLFDATRIDRMLGHYRRLLEAAVADPEARLERLPLLSAAERHQLLGEWNDPARGLRLAQGRDPGRAPGLTPGQAPDPATGGTPGATPEALFRARAAAAPDVVAVAGRGESWSYGALERRVERLARTLRAAGVGPEAVVGVCVGRSPGMVAALLAVLRAGGAYLPLDPSYPAERLAFMMADSGLSVLLADRQGVAALPAPPAGVRRLLLEELGGEGDPSVEAATPEPAPALPGSAAYVIYTSGSTGVPKGVIGTRAAMANLLADRQRGTVGCEDRVLQKTPVSFDASVFEVFSPLVAGGTMVLARPGGEQDAAYLVRLVAEERVTVTGSTPSMLATLLDQPGIENCRTLRRMATGSEAVPLELAERYHALGLSDLYNLYGPTETTVAVLEWHSRPGRDGATLPIGRPIAGARVHLFDAAGEPVPVGVPGELVIGGPPLVRGYLGRPAATAERYVPDPAAGTSLAAPGGRLYRTGDLARRRPDGAVEFLGRIDRQVKVRGFRVELEEIERALLDVDGVREAAVVAREVGSEATRRLVAFLVVGERGRAGFEPAALRDRLAEHLPAFMVPSAFVFLDELPLSPSGKVDRAALARIDPGEEAGRTGSSAAYVAPRDALEHELAAIWVELLGVDRVGVRDDFFELGGHSLLAVRLVARVSAATGRELPLSSLFEASTVEAMAARLRGAELPGGAAGSLVHLTPPGDPAGDRPPLFIVHAIGGSVFSYRELARLLGRGGQPVYGLQARGLAPDGEPHESVEEMAEAYLEAVAAVQPAGPYRLAGWSFGALVAFEMARRLTTRGEAVELLALLDPTMPRSGEAPVDDPDDLRSVELLARDLAALAGVEIDLETVGIEAALREGGPEGALDRVLEAAAEAGALPPEVGARDVRRIAAVYQANARAAARYRPEPLDGAADVEALVVVAEEGGASAGLGRWRELLPAGAEAETLPGDHYSLFRDPWVEALARVLEDRLAVTAAVPAAETWAVPGEE